MYFFAIFHFFSVSFLPVARKKIYIDTNNNSHQIVQSIVDKDNFSFSSMLFACRNLLLIAKKSLSSFEDEITVEDKIGLCRHQL